jgi:protein gp37
MVENSKIEWTDHTFNPWVGCTKVSPACDHCYAEAWSKRSGIVQWGDAPRHRTGFPVWGQPIKWNKQAREQSERLGHEYRPKVFCASLADVFDNQADEGWRWDLWEMIDCCRALDWLLLTKRPQNVRKMLPAAMDMEADPWPWPHVWLGTTVENQEEADRRIPQLLSVPAAKHFLSCEPLLGPLSLRQWLEREMPDGTGKAWAPGGGIDWVICGGESGAGARAMALPWARSLLTQCFAASVPFFMKQIGGTVKAKMPPIPADLMVREFPA